MRNPIFDIMKGLALLLMLIGHMAIPEDGLLYELIYSFHMPLFFILAGYYAKSYDETGLTFAQLFKKDCSRLLVPYIVTALLILLFTALRALLKHDIAIVWDRFCRIGYVTYDAIPCWFLIALLWNRTIFRPIMTLKRWALPVAIIMSGLSILIVHHVAQMPFCFLTAMGAMVFYAIGWWYKHYGAPKWLIVLCFLCWPYTIFCSRLDLYFVRYGIYPITVLGACGGTYAVYWLCKYLYEWAQQNRIGNLVSKIFIWMGVNSLVILCFHFFDIYCCWITMILKGMFNIELSYWPAQLIRDGSVLLFSWLYVIYVRPHIIRILK